MQSLCMVDHDRQMQDRGWGETARLRMLQLQARGLGNKTHALLILGHRFLEG